MWPTLGFRPRFAWVVAPLLLGVSAVSASAQAWLPPKGEGAVSVLYQNMSVKYHALPTERVDIGKIRSNSVLVDVTYGVTDKLAVSFGIPWVAGKYSGSLPHPTSFTDSRPNPLDDGRYHSAFQDFRLDVRYNISKEKIVLTTFAGLNQPSHNYRYYAHAAAGRNLTEFSVGVGAAKVLDAVLPGLFVQGRYAYGFVEKVADISHNRSNADLEIGYFVMPRFRVLALTSGQLTHGGLDISRTSRATLGALFDNHDQVDRLNYLNVGAGAAFSITEKMDIYSSYVRTVAQRNGHMVDHGLSFGLSRSFSTKRAKKRVVAQAERSLVRCVCEKSAM